MHAEVGSWLSKESLRVLISLCFRPLLFETFKTMTEQQLRTGNSHDLFLMCMYIAPTPLPINLIARSIIKESSL